MKVKIHSLTAPILLGSTKFIDMQQTVEKCTMLDDLTFNVKRLQNADISSKCLPQRKYYQERYYREVNETISLIENIPTRIIILCA